jgi:small-conductance mechanosensitive channel
MNNDMAADLMVIGNLFNFYKVFLLLLGGFAMWGLNHAGGRTFEYLMEVFPTHRFTIFQIKTVYSFFIYIAGTVVLLVGVIQPPKEVMIAAAGSIGLALGFALKDVAASILAGIVLLFDRPFVVGDRVTFDNVYGEIISIGLRSVRLVTLDDNEVTIPNARFISEVVASGNAGALDMMVVCDFHLALDADIDRAQEIIHEVIVTSRFVFLKKPIAFVVNEVVIAERLAIRIQAKAYVLDINYEKAFQTDIVSRVSKLFTKYSIPRPAFRLEG